MTNENTTTTDTTTEDTSTGQQAPVSAEGTPEEKPERGSREAAKYRTQLRATETQLADAKAALTAARAQIVTTSLAGHKVGADTFNAAAMSDSGIDPDTLFDEDGTLNQEALDTTMQELHAAKPYLFTPPQKLHIPQEGKSPEHLTSSSWQNAFSPEQ